MSADPIAFGRTRVLLIVPNDDDHSHDVRYDRRIEVVARAHNAEAALLLERELEPDVVVVLVSSHADATFARRLQARRIGEERPLVVVSHDASPDTFATVAEIGAAAIMRPHAARRPPRKLAHEDELSRREQEVLRLAASGLSNAAIARTLWVSHETVKSHLASIYRKLGVKGRREAAAAARALGYLDDVEKVAPMVSV